jgi:hypothetical protein
VTLQAKIAEQRVTEARGATPQREAQPKIEETAMDLLRSRFNVNGSIRTNASLFTNTLQSSGYILDVENTDKTAYSGTGSGRLLTSTFVPKIPFGIR